MIGGRGLLRAPFAVPGMLLAPLLAASPAAIPATAAEEIVRRVGRVTIRVDASQAFPGGVVVVRLSGRRLGAAWALLDGRRAPFYLAGGVPRALVPIAASAQPGPATLGIGISARGGEQRIAIPVTIAAREYRSRYVYLSQQQRELVGHRDAARDGRRLLALVRTQSKSPAPGPLLVPPVGPVGSGYGELRTHTGAAEVESRIDALAGERHRGLDYPLATQTPVRAPSAGTVLLAASLTLAGGTVVIDHGQGVVSVLHHLASVAVREGETVEAGAVVGLSGQSGLAPEPMLQWRVYLHGVAVDPMALGPVLG